MNIRAYISFLVKKSLIFERFFAICNKKKGEKIIILFNHFDIYILTILFHIFFSLFSIHNAKECCMYISDHRTHCEYKACTVWVIGSTKTWIDDMMGVFKLSLCPIWYSKGTIIQSDYIHDFTRFIWVLESYLPWPLRPYITTKIDEKSRISFVSENICKKIDEISFANPTKFNLNMILKRYAVSMKMNKLMSYILIRIFFCLIAVANFAKIGEDGWIE